MEFSKSRGLEVDAGNHLESVLAAFEESNSEKQGGTVP